MPDPLRLVWRLVGLAALYVLATPIFALRAVGALLAHGRTRRIVRSGFLRCGFCGEGNRLDLLVRCPRCGFAEFRSLALPCSECGHTPPWLYCSGCGASLRLP